MLATGVRVGEALAVLWDQVDLKSGTVEITHTIARPPGEGLIRKTTKSRNGERVLSLPTWATTSLRARHTTGGYCVCDSVVWVCRGPRRSFGFVLGPRCLLGVAGVSLSCGRAETVVQVKACLSRVQPQAAIVVT